ncbi:MAG TPA: glycosyltransferase family 39 protein, partial [Flavitalea sp.]|nr:glycosyltransferase family 39 protein [Flavitalea sp.]
MDFIKKHHRLLFYGTWFLLNFIQAWATGLFDDEAYYWIYSKFPAWGYFDHPPMIAMLIKAGTAIFNGELGVRFFIVILNVLTIFIIENLLEKKNPWLFYSICGSIAVAQIGGIIAVPDLPLLFFVSLYFLLYKRFTQNMNLVNSFLLAVGISLMLYSKYHGVLIVLFTLLSNPRLLTRYQTYVAAVISFILFLPHIYWQFDHQLPSVQYHLFERNASHYKSAFTTEYILGQVALAGPLIGWLFLYASMKYKPVSATEKALKWSLAGIYIFFLLSTFKGRVEANWTIPGFVGLIVLSHQYLVQRPALQRWVYRTLPFTLLLVFAGRIYMGLDLPKSESFRKDEFHGNMESVRAIEARAKNENLVVINSYQTPSKYWFYSGMPALGLNTAEYRRNNYNFWPIEKQFIGKPAVVMGAFDSLYLNDRFTYPFLKESGSMHVPYYFSLSAIQLKEIKATLSGKGVSMQFLTEIPADYLPLINKHPVDTAQLYVAVIFDDKPVQYFGTNYKVTQFRQGRLV